MKFSQIAKFQEPIIQNVPKSQKMLIDVQLSISCPLKSDKIKGNCVRIKIDTRLPNDTIGLKLNTKMKT